MVLFELKRIFKTSSFLFIVIIAFIVSVLNVMNYSSLSQQRFHLDNDIGAYYNLTPLLSMHKDEFDYERNQGEQLMDALLVESETQYDIPGDMGMISHEYPKDSVYFETLVEALEIEGVELDEADQADVNYGLIASNYIDAKKEEQSNYERKGAITYLIDGDWILYGIIPILLFSFLAIQLEAEGYSKGSETFHRIVPVSRERTLLSRLVGVFHLLLLYVLCLVLFTWIISVFKGVGWGDWFSPYRVVGQDQLTSLAFIVWLEIISLFIIKTMLVVSFSFLMASLTRRVEIAGIVVLVVAGFAYFMTTYVEQLQVNWNPFHFSYRLQTSGIRQMYLVPGQPNYIEMVIEPITYYTYMTCFALMVVFILLSMYFHRSNQSVLQISSGQVRRTQGNLPRFMTSFEIAKLKNFVPNLLTLGSLLLLVGGLVALISINDYQSRQNEIGPNMTDLTQDRILTTQNNLDKVWQSIEDEVTLLREMSAMIDYYEDTIEYYQLMEDNIILRSQAYQEGDSQSFYPRLKNQIDIHYGIGFDMENVYKYFPRVDYYQHDGYFPTSYGYHVSTERNELFAQRNIRPLVNSAIQLTPYDAAISTADAMNDQQAYQLADTTFLGIWYRLITLYRFDIILLVVLVIFCGVGYGLETGQTQSLSWIYTLPIKRSRIVQQKNVASIIRALQLLGWDILIVVVASLFQDGLGQFQLPILHYDAVVANPNNLNEINGSYHWIDLGLFVIQSVVLIVLAVLFLISLTLLLSTLIRQAVVVVGCAFTLSVLGYGLTMIPQFASLSQYLPFTYLNIAKILDGSIIFSTQLENVNLYIASVVLIVYSMINYYLTTRTVRYMRVSH